MKAIRCNEWLFLYIFIKRSSRYIMKLITFFLVLMFLNSYKVFSQDLETYQWKNRIILLKDTDIESDRLQAQLKRLQSNSKELLEREVLIFLLVDKAVYNVNRNKLSLQADAIIIKYELSSFEGLVLVGKDGEIKLKEEFIINPSEIFELIDSMPMRMAEMIDTKKID